MPLQPTEVLFAGSGTNSQVCLSPFRALKCFFNGCHNFKLKILILYVSYILKSKNFLGSFGKILKLCITIHLYIH